MAALRGVFLCVLLDYCRAFIRAFIGRAEVAAVRTAAKEPNTRPEEGQDRTDCDGLQGLAAGWARLAGLQFVLRPERCIRMK
jgi:hypothetical protein